MVIPSMNETTSILTIPNVTSKDVGTYYCEAWANRMAAISHSANLFLAGKLYPILINYITMYCVYACMHV